MPTIASRLDNNPSQGAVPSIQSKVIGAYNPVSADPELSTTLRCPLPVLATPSPDNLRQYYVGGTIPQYRITPLPSLVASATATGAPGTPGASGAAGPALGAGAAGYYSVWTGPTTAGSGHLDDGVTTPGVITSSEPVTVAGNITAQGAAYKVSTNVVIPSTTTGYHGSGSGDVKIQMSDGTGTSGRVAAYDATGGLTDGPAGISATITTAKLTTGGSQGSMTFVNGILTAQVQAT